MTHPYQRSIPKEGRSVYSEALMPQELEVQQNYPNPFSTLTSFTFKLPEGQHVKLRIYNALGREVAEVANRWYGRGVHSEVFYPGSLPSGVYFYKLISGNEVIQKKMLLLR